MRFESGAQDGALSRQLPRVSSRTRAPSTSTIQRLLRDWSFILSIHVAREDDLPAVRRDRRVADASPCP